MTTEIAVALIAFAGSAVGSLGGIIATSRLTTYRLQRLEEKVDKHNTVIERTYRLEEQMKVANHRIEDIENEERERK